MLFKKKIKDENMITDEEINEGINGEKKSKFNFSKLFSKKKEVDVNTESNDNTDNNIDNSNLNNNNNQNINNNFSQNNLNDQSTIDFNNDFIKNNHPTKTKFQKTVGLITDIIVVIVIGYLVIWSAPKIVNWFTGGRENYADLAKSMAVQIQNNYTQDGQGCTSSINHRFFFNIYNSEEQFGEKYVSPINKQPMEGYIEFEAYKSGFTTYVTLTDGVFGVNHVKLEELTKSDIKFFTSFSLDNYPDMECDKPFVLSKK